MQKQQSQRDAPVESERTVDMNVDHSNSLREAYNRVMECPAFQGIIQKQPPSVAEGGRMAPFNTNDYNAAMQTRGIYSCGANILWVNLWWSATPSMPLNRSGIKALRDRSFSKGTDV